MSATEDIKDGELVTITVKVKGSTIPDTIDVKAIYVEKDVNRIATARISVIDGEASTGTFKASSSDTFVPGNEITIEAGYDFKNQVIFKGIITKQSIRIDPVSGSLLEVECRDEAIKMTVGRKSLSFAKKTDSAIISQIIGTYSGLSSDVKATTTQWPEQIQYYVTDWDFILARAEANGLIATTINNKVSVFAPDANTTPVLTIGYGSNLIAFNADLDAITQLGQAQGSSWDFETQKIATGQATNSYAGPGNLSSKKLSEVVGLKTYELQSTTPLETTDLTNWSKAQLVKSAFSKIRGTVKFKGSVLVDPGKYITLEGLGDRFNGDHLISGVRHTITQGNWITDTTVGLSPIWFTEEPDVMAPPASGLLPGVQGIYSATVKKMYEDPDNQYRILVDIPLFDPNGEGIWARLANFYSTSGAGAFFLPEIGDEVIVGFLNEDPRYPVILGSLYSDSAHKPYTGLDPNEKNAIKAIVSKSGIAMEFDDENIIFTLATPNKNTAIFSDKEKQITIKDENGNSIEMSSSGILIKSDKDITIDATQNLTLKGRQGVKIESSGGDVNVSGMNIKQSANVQFSAKGSASAELDGGAQTTIKGAMVMIN